MTSNSPILNVIAMCVGVIVAYVFIAGLSYGLFRALFKTTGNVGELPYSIQAGLFWPITVPIVLLSFVFWFGVSFFDEVKSKEYDSPDEK